MTAATLLSAAVAAVFVLLAWMAVLAARPAARRMREALPDTLAAARRLPETPAAQRLRQAQAVQRLLASSAARRSRETKAAQRFSEGIAARRGRLTGRAAAPLLVLIAGAAVVVALGNAFAEITDAVMDQDDLTAIDRPVLAWLAQQHSGTLTRIQIGITDLGGAIALSVMLILAAAAACYRLRSWRPAVLTAVVAGGIQLLVFIIKTVIGRARPDLAGRLVEASGFSFPSGHSASALACLGMLAWLVGMVLRHPVARATAWVAAALLTIAIGVSRAYLAVHYPSDILGGWVLGSIWLATVVLVDYLVGHRETLGRGAATPT